MPLPTVERTYQYNVNQSLPTLVDATTNYRALLLAIKQSLVGFGTLPWTVVGSSNGVAAGMDAVDRWSALADVIFVTGASPHSWVVLKQTGLAANFQVLIDCRKDFGGTEGAHINVFVSHAAGFTGGTTSARPTATDEYNQLAGPVFWTHSSTVPFQTALHVVQSTDGETTRVFILVNGKIAGWWIFEKPAETPTGWTPPVVFAVVGANTANDLLTYANFWNGQLLFARINGTNLAMYATGEGTGVNSLGNILVVSNEVDSTFPFMPIGMVNTATAGRRGRHGRFRDMWWGQASAPPSVTGTTYPLAGTKLFVQFGHMIFPWNGTTPLIA